MTYLKAALVLVISLVAPFASCGQTPADTTAPAPLAGSISSHPGWPRADSKDVRSIESITAAVYDVLSGPAVQTRNWGRFRSLFLPDAQLIPTRATADAGHTDAIVLTPELYIARASRTMATQGFFERGVASRVEQFGNIAHVWSTYESRHTADDPTPFARGINSFQLLKDGDRYWIVQILWDAETPINRIPEQYLPARSR